MIYVCSRDLRRNNKYKKDKRKPIPLSKTTNKKPTAKPPVIPISGSSSSDEDDKPFRKREVVSNSSRYDVEREEENEQMLAADFSELLNAPQATGGHFQFSSEKSWTATLAEKNVDSQAEKDDSKKYFHQFFNLNLSRLNDSIITIPFYERLDLDRSLFTESEIQSMDEKAKKLEETYKKIYKNDMDKNQSSNQPEAVKPQTSVKLVDTNDEARGDIDLDELLEIVPVNINQKATVKEKIVQQVPNKQEEKVSRDFKGESSEDMQKWLDDVLND